MTKRILIDLSHLGSFCGFGNICDNYAPRIARTDLGDVRLVLMVPERYVGAFGDGVDYVAREHALRDLHRLNAHIDLWHSTDQLFGFRLPMKGTKYLLTVHDLNFLYEKKHVHKLKYVLRMYFRLRHSDYITTISNYARDDVKAHYRVESKFKGVIYNGIQDMDMSNMRKPDFIADENEKFFFTIGQIREKKNFHKLVPMMKHFPDHKLYICGDKHFRFSREHLIPLVEKTGEGRVVLTGKITDAEKQWMYAHAQAFLFPSRLEGFGLPVLEAMRFGCRVFSSRMSSLPEVCGPHACYFDSLEPQAMADVVRAEVARWNRDGEEARAARTYSEGFTYEKYTQAYVSLYKRLLAEG